MGRIQRPLNYKSPTEKALIWLAQVITELRAMGTWKEWMIEFLGCLAFAAIALAFYCLTP